MNYSWLALIAFAFTAIYAQNVPQCIQDCITAQCPDRTDNVACFCDPANGPPIQDCIAANCSNRQAGVTTSLQNLCSLSSETSTATNTVSTSSTKSTVTLTTTIAETPSPSTVIAATSLPTTQNLASSTVADGFLPVSTAASTTTPTPTSSPSNGISSSAIGGIATGTLIAGLIIIFAGLFLRRRRRARFGSESSRSSVYSTNSGGMEPMSHTNEKLFPYGNGTDSGLHLQRLATPESEIVTVAGPQYNYIPHSTF